MKTVYLTSGPRGAGKSTYVSKVKRSNPEVLVIDRDAMLLEEFGSVGFDPYSGMHIVAQQLLEQRIKEVVSSADENAKIILDAWNGFFHSRLHFVRLLRKAGADLVVCWYFVTPLPACIEWFMKKPDSHCFSEVGCIRDYDLYHEEAADINHPEQELYHEEDVEFSPERFDLICRINPLQLTLPEVSLI